MPPLLAGERVQSRSWASLVAAPHGSFAVVAHKAFICGFKLSHKWGAPDIPVMSASPLFSCCDFMFSIFSILSEELFINIANGSGLSNIFRHTVS